MIVPRSRAQYDNLPEQSSLRTVGNPTTSIQGTPISSELTPLLEELLSGIMNLTEEELNEWIDTA